MSKRFKVLWLLKTWANVSWSSCFHFKQQQNTRTVRFPRFDTSCMLVLYWLHHLHSMKYFKMVLRSKLQHHRYSRRFGSDFSKAPLSIVLLFFVFYCSSLYFTCTGVMLHDTTHYITLHYTTLQYADKKRLTKCLQGFWELLFYYRWRKGFHLL